MLPLMLRLLLFSLPDYVSAATRYAATYMPYATLPLR